MIYIIGSRNLVLCEDLAILEKISYLRPIFVVAFTYKLISMIYAIEVVILGMFEAF